MNGRIMKGELELTFAMAGLGGPFEYEWTLGETRCGFSLEWEPGQQRRLQLVVPARDWRYYAVTGLMDEQPIHNQAYGRMYDVLRALTEPYATLTIMYGAHGLNFRFTRQGKLVVANYTDYIVPLLYRERSLDVAALTAHLKDLKYDERSGVPLDSISGDFLYFHRDPENPHRIGVFIGPQNWRASVATKFPVKESTLKGLVTILNRSAAQIAR